MSANRLADEHTLHGVSPEATLTPCALRIAHWAAPSHPAVTEPDTVAPTGIAPRGSDQVTWQPVVVEVVVEVPVVVVGLVV